MEAVVSVAIAKVAALVLEEAIGAVLPLRRLMLRNAQAIQDRVREIRDFLRDSAAMRLRDEDEMASSLIREVEALLYDAEDCLDEYGLIGRGGGGWGQLFLGPNGPFFAFSVLRQMRNISGKLRLWLEDAGNWFAGRSGAGRVGGDVRPSGPLSDHLRVSDSIRRRDARPVTAVTGSIEEYEILGLDAPKERLLEWLLRGGSELSVIAVVGMGGIGKTTLAQVVYNDRRVTEWFDLRAWVCVSRGYDSLRLLADVHLQLSSERVDLDMVGRDVLLQRIRSRLQSRRYVVVLDDVWDANAWEDIKLALPDGKTGSRILVTSRSQEVAVSFTERRRGYVLRLGALSEEDSLDLFRRSAFPSETGDRIPEDMMEVAMAIVKHCRGLPLAIKTLGSLLANTPHSDWERILEITRDNVIEVNVPAGVKVKRALLLSYQHLNYDLGHCLLYLSIYPEEHRIRRGHLLRLWAAEGFVTEQPGLTAEEVAETYLNELIDRSLVQVLDFDLAGKARNLSIHDIIRELIVSKSADEDFVLSLSGEQISSTSTTHSGKVRRLSIIDGGAAYTPGPKARLSRVRTLITFHRQRPLAQLTSTTLDRFRLLRVLDLEGAEVSEFPAGITSSLRLLKYLSLKHTQISSLPSSIGGLANLETLDLRGTRVRELPAEIVALTKLRHLLAASCKPYTYQDLYESPVCVEVPAAGMLRRLAALEKLSGINLTHVVEELQELTRLRTLTVAGVERENAMRLCESMDKLGRLRSFKAHSLSSRKPLDLRYLNSPPTLLEKLYLNGPIVELPGWIASLENLVEIVLQRTRISGEDDHPLKHLQALPSLRQLDLWHDAYVGEHLCFGEEGTRGFKELRVLKLRYMFGLEMVTVRRGTMGRLEKLVIERCLKLKQMPLELEHLTNLKELYLLGASDACAERLRRDGGEDWCRVAHVPLIRID